MCATLKFELKKHLCEKRGQLLKEMSKYQNIKIGNNWFVRTMDVSGFVLYFQFEIFCRS